MIPCKRCCAVDRSLADNNRGAESEQKYHADESVRREKSSIYFAEVVGFNQSVLVNEESGDGENPAECQPMHTGRKVKQNQYDKSLKMKQTREPERVLYSKAGRDGA